MEHRTILGGSQFLPFARSCVAKLKKLGLAYASQSYEVDGCSIKVRIEPGHEYIRLEGGGGLHMLINLAVTGAGYTGSAGGYLFKAGRAYSLVYKLDARDPMDAKKAKLVYSGGTDAWTDYTGSTLNPSAPKNNDTEFTHSYSSVAVGEQQRSVDGAFVLSGKLLTWRRTVESSDAVYYVPQDGSFSYSNFTRNYWRTEELQVDYGGGYAGISDQLTLDVTQLTSGGVNNFNTAQTYTGMKAFSWPYFMSKSTLADGRVVPAIHLVAGPAGVSYTDSFSTSFDEYIHTQQYADDVNANAAARTEYKWSVGAEPAPEFIKDLEAATLWDLPPLVAPRTEPYTYGEIGFREKGYNFIKFQTGAITRDGYGIPTAADPITWRLPGDMLSKEFYVGSNVADRTFQVKRLVDDVRFGSRMVLADLPGILVRPATELAAKSAQAFVYMQWLDPLRQKSFTIRTTAADSGTVTVEASVTFLNDLAHQMDPQKEWSPRTKPEAPAP